MNLYLISQTVNHDYDTYDSAVVAAESEEQAREMQPDGNPMPSDWQFSTWAKPEHVTVRLIGVATNGTSAGVICASFNAG